LEKTNSDGRLPLGLFRFRFTSAFSSMDRMRRMHVGFTARSKCRMVFSHVMLIGTSSLQRPSNPVFYLAELDDHFCQNYLI